MHKNVNININTCKNIYEFFQDTSGFVFIAMIFNTMSAIFFAYNNNV